MVTPPELELGEDEFLLKITTSSLSNRGYAIPTRLVPRFKTPEEGGGYDLPCRSKD